jgi:hypothetical protein
MRKDAEMKENIMEGGFKVVIEEFVSVVIRHQEDLVSEILVRKA